MAKAFLHSTAHLSVKPTILPPSYFKFPPPSEPTTLSPPPGPPTLAHPFTIPTNIYDALLDPSVPITIALIYISVVTYLNNINVKSQQPWAISRSRFFKPFVLLHNLILAVYSAWTLVGMINAVALSFPGWRGEYGVAGAVDSLCKINGPRGIGSAASYNETSRAWTIKNKAFHLAADGLALEPSDAGRIWNEGLAFYGWLFYLSKFYEVIDTGIILAKGRKSSLLQTYHHAGAMLCMWAGIRYMSPPIWMFVLVNSGIHAIMYSFYFCSAIGIRVPKKLKQSLTTLQITQFVVGAIYAFSHLFVAYQIPVSVSYLHQLGNAASSIASALPSDLSLAESTALASATGGAGAWLKKAALRAAGREGLAENVLNDEGQTFDIGAVHAMEDFGSQQELRFRSELQWTHCLDTSGQVFAILLNCLYLAPLTWLFVRFFITAYLKRAERRRSSISDNAVKSLRDASKGFSRQVQEMHGPGAEADEAIDVSGMLGEVGEKVKAGLSKAREQFDKEKRNEKLSNGMKQVKQPVKNQAENAQKTPSQVLSDDTRSTLPDIMDEGKEKAADTTAKAKDKITNLPDDDVSEQVRQKTSDAAEEVEESARAVGGKASELQHDGPGSVSSTKDKAVEGSSEVTSPPTEDVHDHLQDSQQPNESAESDSEASEDVKHNHSRSEPDSGDAKPEENEVEENAQESEAPEEVKDAEVTSTEVNDTDIKDAEVKDTVVNDSEIKDTEMTDAETKDTVTSTDVEDAETKDVEAKDADIKDAEVSDAEVKDSGIKDAEVNDVEVNDAGVNDAEVNDAEVEDSGIKDVEAKNTEAKDTEVTSTDVEDVETKDAELTSTEVEDAEVKDAERNDAKAKDEEVTSTDVEDTEAKYADVKDAEVTDAETKDEEVTSTDVEDTEAKDADVKDAEVTDAETKDEEVTSTDVEDTEKKDAEVTSTDVEDTEVKDAERKDAEAKDEEVTSTYVEDTEKKDAEVTSTDVEDTEVKDAEAKDEEVTSTDVEDTEKKDAEVTSTDVEDTEAKDADVKDAEVTDAETKDAEAKDAEVNDTEPKDAEVNDTEPKDTETKDAEVKDAEAKDIEAKDADIKDAEVTNTEVNETETKDAEVKDEDATNEEDYVKVSPPQQSSEFPPSDGEPIESKGKQDAPAPPNESGTGADEATDKTTELEKDNESAQPAAQKPEGNASAHKKDEGDTAPGATADDEVKSNSKNDEETADDSELKSASVKSQPKETSTDESAGGNESQDDNKENVLPEPQEELPTEPELLTKSTVSTEKKDEASADSGSAELRESTSLVDAVKG